MHGQGELIIPNKYTYKGNFRKNKFEGYGEIVSQIKIVGTPKAD